MLHSPLSRAILIGIAMVVGAATLLAPLLLALNAPHRHPLHQNEIFCSYHTHHCGPFYWQG